MTPQQFLAQIKAGTTAPAYLFFGPEQYRRGVCRKMIIDKILPGELREDGLTRHDLDEVALRDVITDAGSYSLFATRRVVWVSSAEAPVPKGTAKDDDSPGHAALQAYLKNPNPDVTLVFDAQRLSFDSDDKAKMDRLLKFYGGVSNVVEFTPYTADEALKLAADLARKASLKMGPAVLESLVASLGNDAARIANELEKLALYTGGQREVTEEDISLLAPDARSTTIFALVNAIGRGDRAKSLDLMETLVRDGEYLPLALTLIASQFRLALTAKEENLRTPQQLQAYCAKLGIQVWFSRVQQVFQTVGAYTKPRLEQAMLELYKADKALRDRSPDDRLVMENLVLALTRK